MTLILRHISLSGVVSFCYTPEEFEKGRGSFTVIGEAWREGIELIPADGEVNG